MTAPVSVSNFETQSHSSPDEVRKPDKTTVEIVRLKDFTFRSLQLRTRLELVGVHQAGGKNRFMPSFPCWILFLSNRFNWIIPT